MGVESQSYDNSCSFSLFHVFIARLSHCVPCRCTRCLLVIRRLRSVPLGLWSFIKNNNPSAQRSGSRAAVCHDVVGASRAVRIWWRQFAIGVIVWVCLSSWELVCVFQLVCFPAGNSHWLRNNYPHDLNIIQLISFISQVITQNGAGSLHPRRKARGFAGVRHCCRQLPLRLLLLDGCPRAAVGLTRLLGNDLCTIGGGGRPAPPLIKVSHRRLRLGGWWNRCVEFMDVL